MSGATRDRPPACLDRRSRPERMPRAPWRSISATSSIWRAPATTPFSTRREACAITLLGLTCAAASGSGLARPLLCHALRWLGFRQFLHRLLSSLRVSTAGGVLRRNRCWRIDLGAAREEACVARQHLRGRPGPLAL